MARKAGSKHSGPGRVGLRVGPARPEEAAALVDLWHEGWHDAHDGIVPGALVALRTPAIFADHMQRSLASTLVARFGTEPAGFAILKGDELSAFFVARASRGTPVAPTLHRACLAAFSARGIARPWLICAVGNDRARRFYEREGWSITGERANILREGPRTAEARVLVMERPIASAGGSGD